MKIFKKIGASLLKVLAKHADQIYAVTVMLDLWGHLQPLLRKFDAVFSGSAAKSTPRTTSMLLPQASQTPREDNAVNLVNDSDLILLFVVKISLISDS